MALEAPEEGWVWLQVPLSESVDVVVVGDVETWHTHWYRGPLCKGSIAVRCVKEERGVCEWCRAGYERRARYVFPVRVDEDVRLVELGRVQYPALSGIVQFERWLGSRLRLVRERPVKNAPIQLRRIGAEVLPEEAVIDISQVVAGLGMSNLRMLDNQGALGQADAPRSQANGRLRV